MVRIGPTQPPGGYRATGRTVVAISLMTVHEIITTYNNGDKTGWTAELSWLWHEHRERMVNLLADINQHGIQEPVLIGDDGRVWDGHHRIACALALNIDVPVTFA